MKVAVEMVVRFRVSTLWKQGTSEGNSYFCSTYDCLDQMVLFFFFYLCFRFLFSSLLLPFFFQVIPEWVLSYDLCPSHLFSGLQKLVVRILVISMGSRGSGQGECI